MSARILIIEDNPDNLQLMTYLLKSFGHTILTAMDGQIGLEAVLKEKPDLVICDLELPKMDGYEIARRVRETIRSNEMPLIAVTAYAMVGDREKVMAAGFDGYLTKPITPETFVEQIQAFLKPSLRSIPLKIESVAPSNHRASHRGQKRGTILAVDDQSANLLFFHSMLEPFGFTVIDAQNGKTAGACAAQQPPDLILCDVHIGDESGYDFLKTIKADTRLCHVPFVMISSTAGGEDDRRKGLKLGADKYITRPIEPEAFLAEIEESLGRAKGEKQKEK